MVSTAALDSGFDMSYVEGLARQFTQFPIVTEIQAMSDEARHNLLGALSALRIMRVGRSINLRPGVLQQFLSIEEEFDPQASVEQRLMAGVSWLRQAEMHLFRSRPDSTEMMIIPMNPASRELRPLQSIVG